MKKLFISQPMRGKTHEEILSAREKAVAAAERQLGEKVEVINSFFQDQFTEGKVNPLYWLGKSLCLMAEADVVFFAKGWEEARGCQIENTCAVAYGIDTVMEDDF